MSRKQTNQLASAVLFIALGLLLLLRKLSWLLGGTASTGKGKAGKMLLTQLQKLEGSYWGMLVGLLLLGIGIYYLVTFIRRWRLDRIQKRFSSIDHPNAMEEEEFWNLIDESLKQSEDYAGQMTFLIQKLSGESHLKIIEFHNRFQQVLNEVYTWEVWALAYVINGGCGDDTFHDFTGYLISLGRDRFRVIRDHPDDLAKLDVDPTGVPEWEGFTYISMDAYKIRTAASIPPAVPALELKGEQWDEDDLNYFKKTLPQVWKKFDNGSWQE